MRLAFTQTVAALVRRLGPNPNTWRWGRLHSRQFPSLALIPSLGYGPRSSSGDPWTLNAADGSLKSQQGPSWRFIMDWGTGTGVGVYPGGQSENPVSPWYRNRIAAWWHGRYYPMLGYAAAAAQSGRTTWSLRP